jgi:ComF family protein
MAAEASPNLGLREWTAAALEALRSAVFPPRCLQCRRRLPAAVASAAAQGFEAEDAIQLRTCFCPDCLSAVTPVEPPLCPRCGIMFQSRAGESHPCGPCLENAPAFAMARSGFVYDGAMVAAIHCFKYKGKTRLAGPLGALLWRTFCRNWEGEAVDLVLPVPLHRQRQRRRGFNQSELLLREWPKRGRSQDLPTIASGVLVRARRTESQAGLDRRQRESNIRGAFIVRRPEQVRGRHVLLIDDVITTGATAGECARVLSASGAARVDVLALARVM